MAELPEHANLLHELQAELKQWREQTNDPLINPEHLRRLSAEVRSIKKKDAASDHRWRYPDYFFGREPSSVNEPRKKKKQKSNDDD